MEIRKGAVEAGVLRLQQAGLNGGYAWQRTQTELAQRRERARQVQGRATFSPYGTDFKLQRLFLRLIPFYVR